MAPSPDIDETATEKRVYMSGEGAVRRDSRSTSVNIEVSKIGGVVRE
jgi:hypothetical protein